uniref:Uncharacterized protein MANES_13G087100 n=1 Tax=Rhizophora mucronata TaxID=61149 RepID=A0A2P2KC02_RHIMU
MAASATPLKTTFSCPSPFPYTSRTTRAHLPSIAIRAVNSAEPEKQDLTAQTKTQEPTSSSTSPSSNSQPSTPASKPKRPVYSMKKGQIVRVDKEKYLNSINVSIGLSFPFAFP